MALTKITGQVINTATDVTVGVLTVTNALSVGGTVSVGGTLTYEDVTNVDSVGIITARSNILVGSGITLSPDGHAFVAGVSTIGTLSVSGIVTATGDVDSSTGTITSSGDVNIGTGGKLVINGNGSVKDIEYGDGTTIGYFRSNTNVNRSSAGAAIHTQQFRWNNTKVAEINAITGDDTTNKDNGHITFETAAAGTTGERLRIASGGNIGIGDRTTSPDELLHVHTASGEAKIHVEAATNARVRIRAHSGESIVQFADAASSNPGEVNYAHSSNSMSFRTNGNARVTINSDGIMTKTHHPSFSAHTTNTTSANTDVVFNATVTNIGSHYSTSNGRFTAPVAGNYYFGFYGMSPHADSTNIRCYFKINGAAHSSGQMYGGVGYAGGTPSNGYTHISMETILPLSANDYVNVYWQNTSMHSEHCKFNGFLIG